MKQWGRYASAVVMTLVLASCASTQDGQQPEYRSAGKLPPLEVPPELTRPGRDDRYDVPDVNPLGVATFSGYNADRAAGTKSGPGAVLPEVPKVRIARAGNERWLVVPYPPEKVWPIVREFWQENGFLIKTENPEAGVMETDWAEYRPKMPMDSERSFFARVLNTAYSNAERDKFRTRLERGTEPDTTEIYVSYRGMEEAYVNTMQTRDYNDTRWVFRNPDPGREAEFLRRLMLRFGLNETQAKAQLAPPAAKDERARFTPSQGGIGKLEVLEPFDRAWRRVGLALDRLGFTVEDRDRSKGFYFVRYADPEVETKKESDGVLSKLAFWRSSEKPKTAEQYRVLVAAAKDACEIQLFGREGSPINTETANRILSLLHEQLR